jgi:hypothetical protein
MQIFSWVNALSAQRFDAKLATPPLLKYSWWTMIAVDEATRRQPRNQPISV